MKLNFACVKRKEIYSPNHITNDSLILNKTADVLIKLGHTVKIYDEAYIEVNDIEEKYIFSMAQGLSGILRLQKMKGNGAFVLNTPASALNSYRTSMVRLLMEADIPFPNSIILDKNNMTEDYFSLFQAKKVWLKRGDVHAEHKEDVTLIYSESELNTTLEEFSKRGIGKAVIQEHLQGDTIKFYGISGKNFLHWYYLNGNNHVPFDENELKKLAFSSAEVLGLDIFGGDVIISPEGTISVIDVNDWPSFAPVRDEAAEHIGQLIHKKALNYVHQN
jgi:glutathione synthase/RimK-type ligase-like ATP-grasp enzyme